MTRDDASTQENASSQPAVYQIRVEGHLFRQWTSYFDGLTVTQEEDGNTLLEGPVIDQAALFGLMKKVRDFGMTLVSVNRVESLATRQVAKKET